MKIQSLLTCTAAAAALLLTGCYSTVNTVENADKAAQRDMVTDQRVITDAGLNRKVSIVGVNTAMTSGGLLKVQVEVENRTRSLQRFLYKFEWFDANGMQVNNVLSANIPEQLEGKESKMIFSIAPNPNCRDFRVKFIEAK
ncbi:MAG TPA: YcfL family protein [Verrucomicrobiae bacterium]